MKAHFGLLLFALLVVVAVSALAVPIDQLLVRVQRGTMAYPALAVCIVGAAFLLGVILLLPVSPIVMLAGFLFGALKGFTLIWVTGLLASSLAFWISRNLARQWVEHKLKSRTIFIAVDRAIGRNGLWIVLLTRLAMVFPFGLLNYSFGLSCVRYRDYLIGTNIGMIPPMLLVVYAGTTASSVTAMFSSGVWPKDQSPLLTLLAFVIVALAAALVARSAVRVLRDELAETENPEAEAPEGES